MSKTARIFKLERLNTHNGSGYRTVVYFKGCPLTCQWCHNPEGMQTRKEVWLLPAKCIKCGECVQNCPSDALSLVSGSLTIDRSKCTGCYTCVDGCPAKAIEKIGEDYTTEDIFKILIQDKIYFETSEGGLTVTGGEPGLYYEFVSELFQKCRKEGIQTAFDTSGSISEKALKAIIPFTDMVFLDFKIWDTENSLNYTSLNPEKAKDALRWIQKFRKSHEFPKVQIRTPLIPGATDQDENLLSIGKYVSGEFPDLVELWEWCLFNDLCEDKYQKLDKSWAFKGQKHISNDFRDFTRLKSAFPDLKIEITGFYEK
jgi:pyruvate formate lyase activating enzyme